MGRVSSKTKGPRQLGAPISHGLSPRKLENIKNAGVKNQWENSLIFLNNKASIDNRYIYFDLIVSYLIILTTKFVKLPILYGLRSRHAGLENKFR